MSFPSTSLASRHACALADCYVLVCEAAELRASSDEVHVRSAELRRHSTEVIASSHAIIEHAHALRAKSLCTGAPAEPFAVRGHRSRHLRRIS
jgi:hypothetical protein